MSYTVRQKIKGRYYLYEVTSVWDKEKKKPIQKRKYIGPENGVYSKSKKLDYSKIISKNHGNIALLEHLATESGVKGLLGEYFPDDAENILNLAYYDISEASAGHLFHYWVEEQNLPKSSRLHSSQISGLYESLGLAQATRLDFNKAWITYLNPNQGVYYDITSVSSYSTEIDFVEWGYNRDKEDLAQINIGMACCQKTSLPFYYNIFPGSIVDVSTIKNFLKYLEFFDLKQIKLVMDRGFCSMANLSGMYGLDEHFEFLQPLSFSLQKAKDLVMAHKKELKSNQTAFKYKEEIIHYVKSEIAFNDIELDAHIYFNEKAELEQRHLFLSKIMDIESQFNQVGFQTIQECENAINAKISSKYRKYFKWNEESTWMEKDMDGIDAYLYHQGYFIVVGRKSEIDKCGLLDDYRNKDMIEKIFDVLKNEMDGNRLRVHSDTATQGKLFVKFIALILYMKMSKTMKENKLFDKMTIKEVLLELRKIKKTFIDDNTNIISEITKKQRLIAECFNLKIA
ncbi:MAG: IS1634 family transposase [Bacteroidales bacterium]